MLTRRASVSLARQEPTPAFPAWQVFNFVQSNLHSGSAFCSRATPSAVRSVLRSVIDRKFLSGSSEPSASSFAQARRLCYVECWAALRACEISRRDER